MNKFCIRFHHIGSPTTSAIDPCESRTRLSEPCANVGFIKKHLSVNWLARCYKTIHGSPVALPNYLLAAVVGVIRKHRALALYAQRQASWEISHPLLNSVLIFNDICDHQFDHAHLYPPDVEKLRTWRRATVQSTISNCICWKFEFEILDKATRLQAQARYLNNFLSFKSLARYSISTNASMRCLITWTSGTKWLFTELIVSAVSSSIFISFRPFMMRTTAASR